MKYLKTYTAACWEKKIHTCTELLCTWRPQPPLNSLLTLLCPPWSLLRCEFKQVRSVLSQLPWGKLPLRSTQLRVLMVSTSPWFHYGVVKSLTPWWSSPASREPSRLSTNTWYPNLGPNAPKANSWSSLSLLVTLLEVSQVSLQFDGFFFKILIFLLVFCAIVSHPADTVVSYMNKSQGSTVGSAAKALGFKGMWAGLGPRIVMIGTLTALQWFIYDFVKVTLRLPRPPPPAVRFYFLLPFKNNKECMKWWYSLCELEFPSILWWVLSITIICALGYKKSWNFSIFIWSSFSFRCPSHWRKSLALSNSNLKIDINNLDWGGKHFKI